MYKNPISEDKNICLLALMTQIRRTKDKNFTLEAGLYTEIRNVYAMTHFQ
jgi:hypothetical protein